MEKDPIICTYPKLIKLSQLQEIIKSKDNKDKATLISVIEHRLSRRFLTVIDAADKKDLSSFMSMAICCLIIETLECFYQGLEDTKKRGAGKAVFKSFFEREKNEFQGMAEKSEDFYENVRCGLLHQAETMNGWFLNKNGKIFEMSEGIKIINGSLFFNATKKTIENYLKLLKEKPFDDELWKFAIKKLEDVCRHCKEIKPYN